MQILYLCADLGISVLGSKGASVHVRELVAAFGRSGHSVVVATALLNKSPWEEPARMEARLVHVPIAEQSDAVAISLKNFNETLGIDNTLPGELRRILYNEDVFRPLKRRFEGNPPDFIYERASLYSTAGVLLAQALNRPLLLELNSPLALEQGAYRGTAFGMLAAQAERWALPRSDAVLAVSEPLREHVLSLGVDPIRVHVIPNGVNAALFYPAPPDAEVRVHWGLGEGPILGFVGGLRPWHGVEILPTLLHRLIPRYPSLRLVLVGEGPLRGVVERGLHERGLTQHAVFTGAMPHAAIPALIRNFDVALAPYPPCDHAFYFSPLKLFEYMACGASVVAAGLGQVADVIQDGVTGLLYPPGDTEALTAACDRLLVDPPLRQHLGEAAAKEVHGKYTWNHNAARVADLARLLIAARRVR